MSLMQQRFFVRSERLGRRASAVDPRVDSCALFYICSAILLV
jgi:hypothetical protein